MERLFIACIHEIDGRIRIFVANTIMITRILILVFSGLVVFQPVVQAQNKAAQKVADQLRADVTYLASDDLEGRRTGTDGERKAADYIEQRYKDLQIQPYKNQYRYPFHFIYGKEIASSTQVRINNVAMQLNDDAFPLPFSANKHVAGDILPEVMEQGNIWLMPLYTDQDQANDAHFEAESFMYNKAKEVIKQGASGVVFYDSYGSKWEPMFNRHSDYEQLDIPVVYLTHQAYQKYVKQSGGLSIDLNISINRSDRTGTNIVAYIDNKSPYTVVLGAHYDHLGYGEDDNSLFPNAKKAHQVHHGADDNASGTAALLEIAKWAKHNKKLHHFNYLFINFSGEELGLYGSKLFVKDEHIDSSYVAYMINMDMIGRLNDSANALTIGGVGTSPAWEEVVSMGDDFKLNIDSSGIGPSDHTSFYNAGIPVLFFFTGSHKDYHKPSDKPDLVNYAGETKVIKYIEHTVSALDKGNTKPVFTQSKQAISGGKRFRVTLGIMPDYTFQDGGVRIDGVSDDRPAMKAGLKQGDIITRLGSNPITGMQSYMDALGKYSPGDKTQVTLKRDGKEIVLPIELSK